jgi:RNA polymerase sigma-70 factor (ECF subfamily)
MQKPDELSGEPSPNGQDSQTLDEERVAEVALIERAKLDPTAFADLYERYVDRIYAYIYYRTGDVRDAEDLTARVFYRALAHLPDFNQTGAPFIAWLYRIAHNLVANWHRDNTRHPEVPLDLYLHSPVGEGAPHAQAERAEAESKLLEAIRALPDDRQQLLLLKFVDGLSNLEIGKILGRSEGAIKSLYHRTLLTLREEMEKRGILEWE